MAQKEDREYYYDNLKAVLIFLVVLGHFTLKIKNVPYIMDIQRMIYSFHMPLFVFVTGFFARHMYRQGKLKWEKIVSYALLYVVFVSALECISALAGAAAFDGPWLLEVSAAPWYLLASIVWYVLTLLFGRLKPAAGLLISLAAALAGGYLSFLGDFLALSRIIVFFPFFLLGFYARNERIFQIVYGKWRFWLVGAGVACAVCIACFQNRIPRVFRMVYGNIPYEVLGEYEKWGALARLFLYAVAVVVSLGVMCMIPRKKTWFSFVGESTLQIYVFHKLLRNVIQYTPVLPCAGLFKNW